MKYLIASNVAIDKIYLPDGSESEFLPGGAGLHALSGIQLWTDDVHVSCGIGNDFDSKLGNWFSANGVSTEYLEKRSEITPQNNCTYTEAGDRIDETIFGLEHYISLDCHSKDIRRYFEKEIPDAVYTFRDDEKGHWDCLKELKEKHEFILEWEINAQICKPEKLPRIKEILSFTDVFSINKKEAFSLFNVESEEEAIKCLMDLDLDLIVFRTGAAGLYVIMDGKYRFYPSLEKDQTKVLDVTGCGNSSSASSLWAYTEGYDMDGIGNAANIASYLCLKEWSVMSLNEEKRKEAFAMLSSLGNKKRI